MRANYVAQNFKNAKQYTTFHHPLLTAVPPASPILPHPEEYLFVILRNDEKVSTKLFARIFSWINENILHYDIETGGRVKEKWYMIVAAIVHPDSTIAYYKVYDGIHKPLEGTAGV
jgi:Sen15 protein